MTIESKAAPKAGRIAGTLHKRGYLGPAPDQPDSRPRETVEAGEVAGRGVDKKQGDAKRGLSN
ncbi:MAG: hypothetical protein M3Y32_14965 [Pseudomonadota bacterium]|nr:hypothetical protein [Pseudomonadota bacterium]